MSDRIQLVPFLIDPPSRAPLDGKPSGGNAWSLPAGRRPPRSRAAWAAVWTMIATAWRRHRTRVALAQLDAHLLKDIGVTYAEAENEVNKPFWRP